jgi:hypothetical protein
VGGIDDVLYALGLDVPIAFSTAEPAFAFSVAEPAQPGRTDKRTNRCICFFLFFLDFSPLLLNKIKNKK